MRITSANYFNEKLNKNQNFKGKVSPKLYQQRIPANVDDRFIKAKMNLDKIISKCGDDLRIYPACRFVAAKIANVNRLESIYWPMPQEGIPFDSDAYGLIMHDSLERSVLIHFKDLEKSVGIDKYLLSEYQTDAIQQALYKNLSPEEVVELRKDCGTLLKYQKRNRIGYEQNEEFPFSWKKVKIALEIKGIDPNPSEDLLQKSKNAKQEAKLDKQRKIEDSPINRIKRFFGIKK